METDLYKLSETKLEKLFKIKNEDLSYFEIVVLLDYIGNNCNYTGLKDKIIDCIKRKLSIPNPLLYAENFYLLFDLIKSPYIDEFQKKEILRFIGIKKDLKNIINEIKTKEWFYDWYSNISIKELLEVKEWTSPYI